MVSTGFGEVRSRGWQEFVLRSQENVSDNYKLIYIIKNLAAAILCVAMECGGVSFGGLNQKLST